MQRFISLRQYNKKFNLNLHYRSCKWCSPETAYHVSSTNDSIHGQAMSKAGEEWDAVRAEWSSNRKGKFKAIRVYSLAGNWDWDLGLKIISLNLFKTSGFQEPRPVVWDAGAWRYRRGMCRVSQDSSKSLCYVCQVIYFVKLEKTYMILCIS